ncbi:MAG: FecR family protein [Myxococcota bacterium]
MSARFGDHLPEQIGELISDPDNEEEIQTILRGADRRVRTAAKRRRAAMSGGALVLGATLMAGFLFVFLGDAASPAESPEFLTLSNGDAPVAVVGETLVLSDRSEIEIGEATRWIPVRNASDVFESELSEGDARFHITPGGPRRWTVRAGTTTIEVLGTSFRVNYRSTATEVHVERGEVQVRDPRLSEEVVTLRAGQSVRIKEAPSVSPSADETPVSAPEEPLEEGLEGGHEEPSEARPDWHVLAEASEHRRAFAELGPAGVRREAETASVETLFLLADVARLSGHPAEAVGPLEKIMELHPQDSRAAVAGAILGRIEMDQLNRPDRARHAFERAEALGLPPSLGPDVRRRLDALRP